MPWSAKQYRLFEAAAHNPRIAKERGIPQATAARMASEGVKVASQPKVGSKGRKGADPWDK
jgi:hypothetical protein